MNMHLMKGSQGLYPSIWLEVPTNNLWNHKSGFSPHCCRGRRHWRHIHNRVCFHWIALRHVTICCKSELRLKFQNSLQKSLFPSKVILLTVHIFSNFLTHFLWKEANDASASGVSGFWGIVGMYNLPADNIECKQPVITHTFQCALTIR